ncbi:MAG: Transcriptional regulator, AcrR family [uncultured Thermomicrobiales bacterium]|uniref:Transcriptional regulator, AcrR family n=1 Tax=uncultured Thermomicrobiales bacterium TaxID=1645740 RepID=A0A6J4UXE3_9BACT|nr:MAG: Transcriptional regulator, AcrR family [uncultured Thermomicrobiales bacterium]
MGRDAEETRRRLLRAATEEFAERGLAGARVDRIAAAAGASKPLLYTYFGNKDDLFDAVYNRVIADFVLETPLDPYDLPGYAAQLFDRSVTHPELIRLTFWDRLERGGQGARQPVVLETNRNKVAAIQRAQDAGGIADRFPAGELLLLITTLAATWAFAQLGPDGPGTGDVETPRATLVRAIRLLIEQDVSADPGRAAPNH